MAVTAKTLQGGTPPWRIEPDQPKDNGQSANNPQSQKKRKGASGDTCSANNDGKTTTKNCKRSSSKGDNNKDKAAGAKRAPGVTNVQWRPMAIKRQAHKVLEQKTTSTAPRHHLMAMQSTTNRELKMQIPMNREQMRSPKKLQEVTNAALMNHL
jgi:hypothetical protein